MQRARLHTKQSKTQGGFSLVEILVAVSVFLIFVTAVTGVTTSVVKQTRNSINKNRATALAEEAVEVSHNIRDLNFTNLAVGTFGLSTTSGVWSFSGTSDTEGIFKRQLVFSTANTNKMRLDATVSWADQTSPANSVTLSTYLTNWRKITPEAGLTVTKTVLNHGGSKTAADFAPYNLTATVMAGDPPAPTVIITAVTLGVATQLNVNTYTVSESTDPNYTQTFSGDCDVSGSVVLSSGDAKVCTITNEQKVTSVTVNKVIVGGSKVVSDFAPYKVGTTTVAAGVPTTTMSPGTYTVSETVDPNYTQTFSGDCDVSGSVTLVLGTSKVCTITNTQNKAIPSITTTAATAITHTTATSGGNVTSDGGASVTARGAVWSTSANPTTALSTKTSNGTGTSSFTSSITGLTPGTLYHIRAYATNSIGTAYGSDLTFTATGSTISYIGAASVAGTTVTIPAHQVGDLLVIFASRDGNNTAPSLPAGWTNIGTADGANTISSRLAYRIATATNDPSGTWTNATEVIVQIYRGINSTTPIGVNGDTGSSGTTVTYPGLTLTNTSGISWVLGFAGHRSTNTSLETPPAGMVNRADIVSTSEVAGHDTNGEVTTWNATNVSVGGTSSGWRARTLEILSN